MNCTVCGGHLEAVKTDLPFKVGPETIVIFKDLPVLQCEDCAEYLLEDEVMEKVEKRLKDVDKGAELEILRYAA